MTPNVTKPVSRIYRFFSIVYFPTFSETLSFLEGLVDQGKVEVQVRGTIFFPEKKTFLQLFAVLQLRK